MTIRDKITQRLDESSSVEHHRKEIDRHSIAQDFWENGDNPNGKKALFHKNKIKFHQSEIARLRKPKPNKIKD